MTTSNKQSIFLVFLFLVVVVAFGGGAGGSSWRGLKTNGPEHTHGGSPVCRKLGWGFDAENCPNFVYFPVKISFFL